MPIQEIYSIGLVCDCCEVAGPSGLDLKEVIREGLTVGWEVEADRVGLVRCPACAANDTWPDRIVVGLVGAAAPVKTPAKVFAERYLKAIARRES